MEDKLSLQQRLDLATKELRGLHDLQIQLEKVGSEVFVSCSHVMPLQVQKELIEAHDVNNTNELAFMETLQSNAADVCNLMV